MFFELIIVNEIQTSKELFQVPKEMKVPWGKVRSFWRMVKPKLSKICCVLFIVKGQVLSKTNYSSNPTSTRIFITFAIFNQHYKRTLIKQGSHHGVIVFCQRLGCQGAAVAKNVNRTSFLNVAIFFVVTSLCIFSVNMR